MEKRTKWLIGGGVVVAAAVGLIAAQSAAAAIPRAPALPPTPHPIWAALTADASGNYTVPANATFAVSTLTTNPNLAALTAAMVAAETQGFAIKTGCYPCPVGSPPPADWPSADNAGNGATRWGGASGPAPFTIPSAGGVSVWVISSWTTGTKSPSPPTPPPPPPSPSPPAGTTALAAGQYYEIQITTASPITLPGGAAVQSGLDSVLGSGVATVKSIGRVSPGNSPNSASIVILAKSAATLSTTQALAIAGLAPSPTGYSVVIVSSAAATSAAYLALVTDTPTITLAQTDLASWLAGPTGKANLPAANYPVASVNGNASDPAWVSTLALFQTWANSVGAPANLGTPFPPTIRTDGVLDVATWTLIQKI